MSCGRCLFHVRTPHRISADIDVLTSAHTGFADFNPEILVGFADLNTAEKTDLRTLRQLKFGFMDLETAKEWICGPEYSGKFECFWTSTTPVSADYNI
jgi:hypothetical protein